MKMWDRGVFGTFNHPVVISDFIEELSHKRFKLLIGGLIIIGRLVNFIFDQVDKPHNDVIIVAIFSKLKLNPATGN